MVRYFKTLFITLVPFVLGFVVCYLVGSFIEVSFDTVLWERDTRIGAVIGGFVWGFALYMKLFWEELV